MIYNCEMCFKTFKFNYLLERHLSRKYPCVVRDLTFDPERPRTAPNERERGPERSDGAMDVLAPWYLHSQSLGWFSSFSSMSASAPFACLSQPVSRSGDRQPAPSSASPRDPRTDQAGVAGSEMDAGFTAFLRAR